MLLTLDHLTVVAATLEEGAAHVEAVLGVPLAGGGRHALMGTHNRPLRLGDSTYREVIARDPQAPPVGRPRWFNLDQPALLQRAAQRPFLATWVARTDDIEATLAGVPGTAGRVLKLSRGDLRWQMAVPDDGSMP